ncbi:uncharacterized protein LOC107269164 isoform X2 [Cephus cinctus]|uniref:Uncharacterized protein LOC107269164 isoform X2 n=1 Tax=Cephus cinctus TaxID=211228 RepID=A0AAJ7RKD7_CEPCN|nr:uncharacterized protein LOC107269164 isoform X2 [Cephus cinctus]
MNIAKIKTSNNKDNQQAMECIQFIDGNEYTDDDVMSSSNKSVDEVINDALLEKLCSFALKPQENDDTIKSILLKIMTRVTSSDRYTRERALEKLWRKNFSNAETFVTLLENCSIIQQKRERTNDISIGQINRRPADDYQVTYDRS